MFGTTLPYHCQWVAYYVTDHWTDVDQHSSNPHGQTIVLRPEEALVSLKTLSTLVMIQLAKSDE